VSLDLGERHRAAIRIHGEETYPNECCGFLLGAAGNGTRTVVRLRRAQNEREDSPRNRFLISPQAYLEAEVEAQRTGLEILGFYHSHPDAPAEPSEYDRDHALPGCSYVIVSVREGRSEALHSWLLSGDYTRFVAETLSG